MAEDNQAKNEDIEATQDVVEVKKSSLLENLKSKATHIKSKMLGFVDGVDFNVIVSFVKQFAQNRTRLYIIIGVLALLLIGIIILFMIFNKEEKLEVIYKPKPEDVVLKNNDITKIPAMKAVDLQSMIKKASTLYNSGNVGYALNLYQNISLFSQSFANYNLGVAKYKEANFKEALEFFNKTIKSGENVAVASINAASIALIQGDFKSYDYYTSLANGVMVEWYDKPLYSYLYSVVNYYLGNYFQTLSSLTNRTSNYYNRENSLLLSKMYLMFNDNFNALKEMVKNPQSSDKLAIAQLYARMGEYDIAANEVDDYINNVDANSKEALMTKALIDIKRMNFGSVAQLYEQLLSKYTQKDLINTYPIHVKLRDTLFDVDELQKQFWKRDEAQDILYNYKILYYFAPYRVFDINNTISLINEGGMEITMNDLQEATNTLLRGEMLSRVNYDIAKGLKEAFKHNINNALRIMQQSAKNYPNHQVLQYNLGLLYAQLEDYSNARKHFIKAYHLDSNDIISGIFALISMKILNQDTQKLSAEIASDFDRVEFSSVQEEGFMKSLLDFVNGSISDDMFWFKDDNQSPLANALRALYAMNSKDKVSIVKAFGALKSVSRNDVVADILDLLANHYGDNMKIVSFNLFEYFKNNLKDFDVINTGPLLARQLYIHLAFLIGANSYVDDALTKKLLNTRGDVSGILQTLALNYIYMHEFEKAFTYYNILIDDYKITSSSNYFFAAVAAIGARHYNNAVALIQLSKLESGENLQARFVLALLYQAVGDFQSAAINFAALANKKFASFYFDFEIDTTNLLKTQG